ncbi:bile acid:sodium symporter family protein [Priestia megaterium]|uniref:bile acid:sodium symporter family protein n=1 Tax=Priestia megaterium TaxID=1404 RepID=UPI003242CD97
MNILTFIIARLMPIWIVISAVLALWVPEVFRFLGSTTEWALALILFMMGLTLERKRLLKLARKPVRPLSGSLGKWVIAPLISIGLAVLFFGMSELSYGIIMAGIVPSGTSANLNTFIAKGDVSLSLAMSSFDTLVGPFIAPFLIKILIGSSVDFDYFSFWLKMICVVFLPLMVGISLQSIFPYLSKGIKPFIPIISSLALYTVVLGIVSNAKSVLLQDISILFPIAICVFLQVTLQMVCGYGYAKLLRYSEAECRAILFEVGICNSALAAVLANDTFGSMASVAAMANMVCNLVIGSFIAAILASTKNSAYSSITIIENKGE